MYKTLFFDVGTKNKIFILDTEVYPTYKDFKKAIKENHALSFFKIRQVEFHYDYDCGFIMNKHWKRVGTYKTYRLKDNDYCEIKLEIKQCRKG